MPTLPLLQTPLDPDAWHLVSAPGGYEGWYFDAEEFAAGVRLIGFIGEGCRFEGLYKSRYQRYRKHPTKNPPPTPRQFPGLEFAILKNAPLATTGCSHGSAPLSASIDHLAIQLSDNQLTGDGEVFRLQLAAENAAAQLVFTPVQSPAVRFSVTPKVLGENHRWQAIPFCQVSGTISQGGVQTPFNGVGVLEHRLGTLPVGMTVRRGMAGRVLCSDRALLFHAFEIPGTPVGQQAELIELTGTSANRLATSAFVQWSRLSHVPRSLGFDQHLNMSHPRMLQDRRIIAYEVLPQGASMAVCVPLC